MPQKVHILVEGEEDRRFLESYVGYLRYEPVELKSVKGKGGLKAHCSIIERELDRGTRVLVVFDADMNYEKRKSEIEELVQNRTGKNSENPNLDFFLFPNNKESGNLEDLLEKIIKLEHKGIFNCFEAYKKCLGKKNRSDRSYVRPNKKAKIYAYKEALGAMEKGKDHFSPEYWEFENSSLDPLKNFLCENFRESGLEKVR